MRDVLVSVQVTKSLLLRPRGQAECGKVLTGDSGKQTGSHPKC